MKYIFIFLREQLRNQVMKWIGEINLWCERVTKKRNILQGKVTFFSLNKEKNDIKKPKGLRRVHSKCQ